MDETQLILRNVFSNPTAILGSAVALGVLFIALLAFDHFVGRKRNRHSRHLRPPPETLGQKLRKPFVQVRLIAKLLLDTAHRRARRRARSERLAEQMRRYRR
jgi:hypothetical protein